jgi:hypothetical protein
MHKFAKLFDVGERQIIVYIECADDADGDEDKYTLHQITSASFGMMDVAFSGPEAAMRKILEAYDQSAADNFFRMPIITRAIDMESEAA